MANDITLHPNYCYLSDSIISPKNIMTTQQIETWIENIGKGRWCWVWDIDPDMVEGRTAMIVTGIAKDGRYTTTGWMKWMYAEPMTRDEVLSYCPEV